MDFAERARAGDWSLRSALVRYAESEPVRVSQVLDLVRRIDFALSPHTKLLQREGPQLWRSLESGATASPGPVALVTGLLRAAVRLDEIGDALAAWAQDRHEMPRPDSAVDAAVADVGRRLDDLGVTREERPPGRRV